jgi:anti-sigma factor (TIGR02949 family)
VNCQDALDRLYEFLDGELTTERAEEVQSHLERCAHCFALSRFEDAFLRFLEARSRARCAPEHLKRTILEQLLTEPDGDTAS